MRHPKQTVIVAASPSSAATADVAAVASAEPAPNGDFEAALGRVQAVRAELLAWLANDALPLWSGVGVDRRHGGFFEKIDLQGHAVEEPRRTRVVARQIYVFSTAARLGWLSAADMLVEHGLSFLFDRLQQADATFAASVVALAEGGGAGGGDLRFDLYEQAFALFALAGAHRRSAARAGLPESAERLLASLRGGWGHEVAGFHECRPVTSPLKSNPHMHLLEAALAWGPLAAPDARAAWEALADELAGLCLGRFIAADTGALSEYFDLDWRPLPGARGCVVEPGHQFEWAWLLSRWGRLRGRADALAAARRLVEIGEAHGVDAARGVAVNALDDGLNVTDAEAKLWPQTERVKAWCAMAELAVDEADATVALDKVAEAAGAMQRYFVAAPAGLWHERMVPDGGFHLEACRASSLYHVVCAIETLDELRLGDIGPNRA